MPNLKIKLPFKYSTDDFEKFLRQEKIIEHCLNHSQPIIIKNIYDLEKIYCEGLKEKEQYANARVLEELKKIDCNCEYSSYCDKLLVECKRCRRVAQLEKQLKEVKQP